MQPLWTVKRRKHGNKHVVANLRNGSWQGIPEENEVRRLSLVAQASPSRRTHPPSRCQYMPTLDRHENV
jgi:hypothetical protein